MENNEHLECAATLLDFGKSPFIQRCQTQSVKFEKLQINDTRILLHWLLNHKNHPYPSPEEKLEMMIRTNLTLTQINNWFSNVRRRHPFFKGKIWKPGRGRGQDIKRKM